MEVSFPPLLPIPFGEPIKVEEKIAKAEKVISLSSSSQAQI